LPVIKPINFEEYISGFPGHVQEMLVELRGTIKKAALEATEVISYGMPGYKLNGSWFGLEGIQSTLGFIPWHPESRHFKKNFLYIKMQKGQFNFR